MDRYGDRLYRYALLRVRRPDLAADLVQETFAEAWRARASFAGRSAEATWLTGILRHKVIDHLRRTAGRRPGPSYRSRTPGSRSSRAADSGGPTRPAGRPTRRTPWSERSSGRRSGPAWPGCRTPWPMPSCCASWTRRTRTKSVSFWRSRRPTCGPGSTGPGFRCGPVWNAAGSVRGSDMANGPRLWHVLNPSCEEVSRLASEGLDRPLTRRSGGPSGCTPCTALPAAGSAGRPPSSGGPCGAWPPSRPGRPCRPRSATASCGRCGAGPDPARKIPVRNLPPPRLTPNRPARGGSAGVGTPIRPSRTGKSSCSNWPGAARVPRPAPGRT